MKLEGLEAKKLEGLKAGREKALRLKGCRGYRSDGK
jgi:hypothetical protein